MCHSRSRRPPRAVAAPGEPRVAFTLIELLVVIATIAILASLLLPALTQARHLAVRAACLSQLREMGVGTALYGHDHDEWFPQSDRHTSKWMIGLAPYCGYGGDVSTLSASSDNAQSVDRKVAIFLCPLTRSWYWRWYLGRCYGINLLITSGRVDIGSLSMRRRMPELKHADRIVLIGDCYHYTPIDWGYFTVSAQEPEESGTPDRRQSKHHDRRLCYLFTDLHVEALRRGQRTDLVFTDGGSGGWW